MRNIALLLFCMAFLIGCHRFPDNNDIDAFFVNIEKAQNNQESYEMTKKFLASIRDPGSISEDRVVDTFFQKLAAYCLKSENANVLRAVDDTRIDGGFANFVCGFYKDVIKSPIALQHYRNNCQGLRRCTGITFSSEDLNNICGGKNTGESAQHGAPPDRR
jgi:hypothetical protein